MTSTDSSSFSVKSTLKKVRDNESTSDFLAGRRSSISLLDSAFNTLALDVSLAGVSTARSRFEVSHVPRKLSSVWELPEPELWDDIGVVEYLERRLGPPDESTPEEREEALREVLAETDIHEGDGDVSDFLFHVARTKHGKLYIRVIRTLLLNRVQGAMSTGVCPSGGGDAVSLELTGDASCSVRLPFDPEEHGLGSTFRLTKFGDVRGKGMKPNRDELQSLLRVFNEQQEQMSRPVALGEDTSVTRLDRMGLHLLETNNILCPVIDDPYLMGKIACASVLSGIYSLGVADCATTRMILAVSNRMEDNERNAVVPMVIRGYRDAVHCVDTTVQSAQLVSNPWFLVGGTATALCLHHELVPPDGATIGDVIVLTKPLGTMVAITVSQWMELPERRSRLLLTITEEDMKKAHRRAVDSMIRTNRVAAVLMRKYNAHAACDVSAYGILGHAEILARRQKNPVSFVIHNMPIIARMSSTSKVTGTVMPLLQGLMPEVSGGLLVVLPREQAAAYCKALEKTEQRQAWIIGIVENGDRTARVIDRPRVIEIPAKENGASLW